MINLIIPAAGEATRLRPLSNYTSKAMVRVNGKPCIDYILEQVLKLSNISETVIVDGKYNDIREYCAIRYPNVKFVKQEQLNGPHDAILIGLEALENSNLPVVVWLGDAIILENDLKLGSDFLLCKNVEDHYNWCMWNGENYYNKPTSNIPNSVALVGLYSFSSGIDALESFKSTRGSYEISDALSQYPHTFEKIITSQWYDIGDLSTYHKTCAKLLNLKARAFHSMEYNSELGVIHKRPNFHNSHAIQTIYNEKCWYNSLNSNQSMFVPRIIPHASDLILSYESGSLLSDLMLYENLRKSSWEYIIDKVFRIKLKYFNDISNDIEFINDFANSSKKIWIEKTGERLKKTNISLWSQDKLIRIALSIVETTYPISGMHGDLHFGNILYNHQTDQLKFIDPRGQYGQWIGSYGDQIYDFAKLAHDLYHGYSALVANVPHNQDVKDIFIKALDKYNLPKNEIINGGLLLIATCVPLHYEDPNRQKRFVKYVEEEICKAKINPSFLI